MRSFNIAVGLLLGSDMLGGTCDANTIALSTFDSDRNGWVGVELAYPSGGPPYTVLRTQTPDWKGSGGNPGGYIENSANIYPGSSTFYWSAPSQFLGDVSGAYGGTLSFDLFDNPINSLFGQEDLILMGNGKTVVFGLTSNPGTNWSHYSITLSEQNWRENTLAGSLATQADMLAVLGNLSSLYIRGEYQFAADTRGLDNVALAEVTAAPEPATLSLALFGLSLISGAAYRRRG